MTTRITRRTTDTADIPLGGNRTLRLALECDGDGRALDLHLAIGFGEGADFREERGEGLSVPASVAGLIAETIDELAGGGKPPLRAA